MSIQKSCNSSCLPQTGTANICITNNRNTPVSLLITDASGSNPTLFTATLEANLKNFCLTTPFAAGTPLIVDVGTGIETVRLTPPYPSIIIDQAVVGSSIELSVNTECKNNCNDGALALLTIVNQTAGATVTITSTSGFAITIENMQLGTYLQSIPKCIKALNVSFTTDTFTSTAVIIIKPFPAVVINATLAEIALVAPRCNCKSNTCNKCETKSGNSTVSVVNTTSDVMIVEFNDGATGDLIAEYGNIKGCTEYCLNVPPPSNGYYLVIVSTSSSVFASFAISAADPPTIIITSSISSPTVIFPFLDAQPFAVLSAIKPVIKKQLPSVCVVNNSTSTIYITSLFSTGTTFTSVRILAGQSFCVNMTDTSMKFYVAIEPNLTLLRSNVIQVDSKCPNSLVVNATTIPDSFTLTASCKKLCKCC